MFRNFALGLVFMGIAAGAVRADSIEPWVLWEHSTGGTAGVCPGDGIPPRQEQWVEFTLEWGAEEVVFGEGLYWYAPGEHIWPDPSTPPEDWESFVEYLTNGSCDGWSRCWGSIVGGLSASQLCDVDLSGFEIDYLRLFVEDITWEANQCTSVSCTGNWEIWGIPEPGSLLLLGVGTALVVRRRR